MQSEMTLISPSNSIIANSYKKHKGGVPAENKQGKLGTSVTSPM